MSKKLNILFLGGGKRNSLAERFLESGRKMNLKVNIFSYEISNEVPINSVAKIIVGLKWNDPKIYSNLLKVIKKFNISFVIANVDQATIVLSKLYNIYPNLNLISSDHKICKILFNNPFSPMHLTFLSIARIDSTNVDPLRGIPTMNMHCEPFELLNCLNNLYKFFWTESLLMKFFFFFLQVLILGIYIYKLYFFLRVYLQFQDGV